MRPNDILDNWGTAELIVAFGEYANEESAKHYEEWKSLDTQARNNTPKPEKYTVYFRYGEEKKWQQN